MNQEAFARPADSPGPAGTGLSAAVSQAVSIQALATAAAIALTAIAPTVAEDLGVPPQWIGYQVSIVYVAAVLFSLVAGGLVRKHGPARISQLALLVGGLGLLGLGTGLMAIGVFASLLIGFGYALTNPAASEVLNRLTPSTKRNLIFSLKQTGVPIGGMFVGLAMPSLALAFGWDKAVAILAALLFVMMLPLQRARPVWDSERNPALPLRARWLEGLGITWRHSGLRALALMGFLFSAMQLCLTAFLVVMMVEEFGWSAVAAGGLAAAVQFAGVVGRLFWGMVADSTRRGGDVLTLIGLITTACALVLPAAGALPLAPLVALLCLFGATSVGWNGVMLAEAARLSPTDQVAPVAGSVLMITFSGVVLGPLLFVLFFELLGSYAVTYAVFAISPLAGSVLVWIGTRRETARAHEA